MTTTRVLLYIFAVATILVGCDSDTVYYQYRHTPITGWEKNDTLFFDAIPISEANQYREDIGLRINNEYPFKSITLIVEQRIISKNTIKRDTIACELTNSKGTIQGQGYTYFQYQVPLTNINLDKGDSINIRVRHGMRQEILSGIQDVGIKISKSH